MFGKQQINRVRSGLKSGDDRLAILFETLGDLTRFRIFRIVASNKDVCATDLAKILNISLPAASYHLKILELAGIVIGQRKGQMICYHVQNTYPLVKKVLRIIGPSKPAPEIAGVW